MKIDELDILLFSGKGLISYITKLLTFSKWSHVGMIIIEDKPLIWECQKLNNISDHHTKNYKKGLQKVDLHDRIREYEGEVWLRRLLIDRDEIFYEKLKIIKKQKFKSKEFCTNFFRLLNAILPESINIGKSRGFFCSELVALIFIQMKIIGSEIEPSKYNPSDFDTGKLKDLFGPLERIK